MASDPLRERLAELSDDEIDEFYGRWTRRTPEQARAILDGLDVPWWIVGGWAIEAATGRRREHADLDLAILERDLPVVHSHLRATHHVWFVGSGSLCPVLDDAQRPPSWAGQMWVRADATSPWELDIIVTPDDEGRWVFKRDPRVVEDLEQVTWIHSDGLRYQRPEVTLAFKAAHARPKDDVDFEAARPHLDPPAVAWLAETIERLHPGHRWLDVL